MADVAAIEDRSNPWRELREFEAETGIEVPIEVKVYDPPGDCFRAGIWRWANPEENVCVAWPRRAA